MIHAERQAKSARTLRGIGGVRSLFNIALLFYVLLVAGHLAEHLIQMGQLYILQWSRMESMGILGIFYPALMRSEVLHFSYNLVQLLGLLVLAEGMRGRARTWWRVAIMMQGWHFFEHFLLQAQWLSGIYLFGAAKQTSIGELFLPRIELHMLYVTLAVVPTAIALFFYWRDQRGKPASGPGND